MKSSSHTEGLHPFLSGMELRLPPSVPWCPGDGRNPPQELCSDHCQVPWMPLGTCTPPHSTPTSPPLPSPILQANASQFRASLSDPTPTAPPVAHTLTSRFDIWSPAGPKEPCLEPGPCLSPGMCLRSLKEEDTLGKWAAGSNMNPQAQGDKWPHPDVEPGFSEGANSVGLAGAGLGGPGGMGWIPQWACLLRRGPIRSPIP